MTHLDLFSGIGGFSLAADWTWPDVEHVFCEIDPFCQAVLTKHWPNATIYGDIKQLDGRKLGTVDLLTGGFPCQPFSVAGQRKAQADDRHLWPEMRRLISETRPTWLIGENVAGIIKLALDEVLSDLESEDYACQAFVIPACAVNAPHRRDRVWIVAHDSRDREQRSLPQPISRERSVSRSQDVRRFAPRWGRSDLYESALCRRSHGISARLDALGNAIVPQVAAELMTAITMT